MTTTLQIEISEHIAILRINRPPANAIDLQMAGELAGALAEIGKNEEVRALAITGAGNCFSAGLDLKVVPAYNRDQQQAMVMEVNRVFGVLYGLGLPTIAAVNGHAIAGGLVLTLACDYRIGLRV
jgi:enoyl-CoA hydratase